MRAKRVVTLFVVMALSTFVACSRNSTARSLDVAPPALFSSDNPISIYAADPNDSWNRIFRALFTRTVRARVSSDFPDSAPFVRFTVRMGSFSLRLSKNEVERQEMGDRGIEPLYPSFLTSEGPLKVLTEPHFSELINALDQAINETKSRTPVERALMQSDAWAAYDIVYRTGMTREDSAEGIPERKTKLLNLLGQFVRKLALSGEQIKSLNNNYFAGATANKLPHMFSPVSGWLEIELLPHRSHDEESSYRRAARVFVKPRTTPVDQTAFVEKLKHNQHLEEVEAVGLVVQNLLIDTAGRVVPSPLFNDVQFRLFTNDPRGNAIVTEVRQYELSRRLLLTKPATGGLVEFKQTSPAYLTQAGNDYSFAGAIEDAGVPIVVPLRTRCAQCHGHHLSILMTYSIHYFPPVPTVKIFDPSRQERTLYVAQRKEQREDFKSLFNRKGP
jgi:hypothetical protein